VYDRGHTENRVKLMARI